MTFNEPVRLESGGITAFDASGDEWETDAVSRDNLVVVTPVGDPGDGTVIISWKVTSEDGHEVSGALTSRWVQPGGAALAAPEAPTATVVARLAAAGLAALGLLGAVGLALRGARARTSPGTPGSSAPSCSAPCTPSPPTDAVSAASSTGWPGSMA